MSFSGIHYELKCNKQIGIDTYFYSLKNAWLSFGPTMQMANEEPESQAALAINWLILKNTAGEVILSSFIRDIDTRSSFVKSIKSAWERLHVFQISGTSFFCGDRFTGGNMCHAIFDHLIRAWQCKESKIYVDQYIFYESTWPWAKMIIEGMLPDSKIIYIKEFQRINFEKVYFCSNSFGGPGDTFAKTGMLGLILKHPACLANKRFLKELRRLTKKLAKNCNQQADENFSKKIFISRKSLGRKFANQIELENAIKLYSYKMIYLEEIATSMQLKIFQNAKTIIGLHGAGLTNIIGCRRGTKVIEIFGRTGTCSYADVAKSLRLNYTHLSIESRMDDGLADLKVLTEFLSGLEAKTK